MRLLAVLVQLLFLAHCSQCWFFERFLPYPEISTNWFHFKVSSLVNFDF